MASNDKYYKPIPVKRKSLRKDVLEKMSIKAAVDDLYREDNGLTPCHETVIKKFMEKCEENRIKWIVERRQLNESMTRIKELENKVINMKAKIKRTKDEYTRLMIQQNEDKEDVERMTESLENIREFVRNEVQYIWTLKTSEQLSDRLKHLSIIERLSEDSFDSNDYKSDD